jgi:signal recognition particle subunit SRP54
MFEALSDKLKDSLKKVRGQSRISEENIDQAIKDIRLSLLEADVNFKVVKEFIDSVKAKAIGTDVLKNVNPAQQFTKIVHDELVTALGTDAVDLDVRESLSAIFMVGLQGSGKTTSSAKLALYVRQKLKRKP